MASLCFVCNFAYILHIFVHDIYLLLNTCLVSAISVHINKHIIYFGHKVMEKMNY